MSPRRGGHDPSRASACRRSVRCSALNSWRMKAQHAARQPLMPRRAASGRILAARGRRERAATEAAARMRAAMRAPSSCRPGVAGRLRGRRPAAEARSMPVGVAGAPAPSRGRPSGAPRTGASTPRCPGRRCGAARRPGRRAAWRVPRRSRIQTSVSAPARSPRRARSPVTSDPCRRTSWPQYCSAGMHVWLHAMPLTRLKPCRGGCTSRSCAS